MNLSYLASGSGADGSEPLLEFVVATVGRLKFHEMAVA